MTPEDNVQAYLHGAAVEAEKHEDTAYELSAEQVAEIRHWLRSWDPCPWCGAGRPIELSAQEPFNHAPDCLLADIVEAPTA